MFKGVREEDQERANVKSLLEAKILDKHRFAISKNKIINTDFFNSSEKAMAEKFLKEQKIENYIFFGGNGEDSERNVLIFYPEKFSIEMVEKNYSKILSGIQIVLPKNLEYEHRTVLSGIMKLGIKREKVGDILLRENKIDIIVLSQVSEFLKSNLQELTRFKSAAINIIDINEVEPKEKEFEEISIIVTSMRLDNFVAELARCSRSHAVEILESQRVFVNYGLETKFSKKINVGDIITIRGKGKFIVHEIDRKTKSEKYIIIIKKFV